MFDSRIRPIIDPVSNTIGKQISKWGISANMITVIGGAFGFIALLSLFGGISLGIGPNCV